MIYADFLMIYGGQTNRKGHRLSPAAPEKAIGGRTRSMDETIPWEYSGARREQVPAIIGRSIFDRCLHQCRAPFR